MNLILFGSGKHGGFDGADFGLLVSMIYGRSISMINGYALVSGSIQVSSPFQGKSCGFESGIQTETRN